MEFSFKTNRIKPIKLKAPAWSNIYAARYVASTPQEETKYRIMSLLHDALSEEDALGSCHLEGSPTLTHGSSVGVIHAFHISLS